MRKKTLSPFIEIPILLIGIAIAAIFFLWFFGVFGNREYLENVFYATVLVVSFITLCGIMALILSRLKRGRRK